MWFGRYPWRSTLLVVSVLFITAAQGGTAQDDDSEWATATLIDCAVETTGDGSFHETCEVESADARLAGTWSFSYDIDTLEGEGVISVDAGDGPVTHEYNPEDVELQFGEVTIVTADGRWEGGARRVVAAREAKLKEFWAAAFFDERMQGLIEGASGTGESWVLGATLDGSGADAELDLLLAGRGDSAGPPYALDAFVGSSDSGYSTVANIARVVFPLIVFALVVAGAGISLLKGHWWMGLLGALGFGVYALWSTQVSLDIDLLGRFEENVENNIGLAIFLASSAGALLLLLGAVLPARSGSWWDRNRTTQPVSD